MAEDTKTEAQTAAPAEKPLIVHQLTLFITGGQKYQIRELSNSTDMPRNYLGFINAWREQKDVWFSPNNDPHFGVRVKEVALYEYAVHRAVKKTAEAEKTE